MGQARQHRLIAELAQYLHLTMKDTCSNDLRPNPTGAGTSPVQLGIPRHCAAAAAI
jgi:hypothetical protein